MRKQRLSLRAPQGRSGSAGSPPIEPSRAQSRGNLICVLLIIGYLLSRVQPAHAQTASGPQLDLAVAKGCYLYNAGKIHQAYAVFGRVLEEDPANLSALEYMEKILAVMDAETKSPKEINDELIGYINASAGNKKIEIENQYPPVKRPQDSYYERFINTFSLGYNKRQVYESSDTDFANDGFYISEHARLDSVTNAYQHSFSVDARYHDNSRDDARIRRVMYSVGRDGMRFIAGDTAARLSRYAFRGLYFRGVDYSMDTGKNTFQILGGKVPNYLGDEEEYIYPRRVFGLRDVFRASERYRLGIAFMHLQDSRRIRTIDSRYNPKENVAGAFFQDYDVIPGKWKLETENAYAFSDEDRSNEDIFIVKEELKDFAHYFKSTVYTPKLWLTNTYEYVGPDFRSYADLSSTVTWLSGLTSDRERFANRFLYRPIDPLHIELHLSRERSNLDDDVDAETIKKWAYGGNIKVLPPEWCWAPQASLRVNFINSMTSPGSDYASDNVSDRDIMLELARRYFGFDLNTSYTRRKVIDNIETFGSYYDIYYISAARQLYPDRVLASASYTHTDGDRKQDGRYSHTEKGRKLDLNTALRLWDSSNLTLGYSWDYDKDFAGTRDEAVSNSYYTTFSWPFTRYYIRPGTELTVRPYYTWQLTRGGDAAAKDRTVWTAALDATYKVGPHHRFGLSSYYRQDSDNKTSVEGFEEYRCLATYKKEFK